MLLSPGRYHVLIEFAHRHVDFQTSELKSILSMHSIRFCSPDCQIVPLPNSELKRRRSFLILSLPDASLPIASMLSRCVLIRAVVELWGYGTSLSNCATEVQLRYDHDISSNNKLIHRHHRSWKMSVQTFGTKE